MNEARDQAPLVTAAECGLQNDSLGRPLDGGQVLLFPVRPESPAASCGDARGEEGPDARRPA